MEAKNATPAETKKRWLPTSPEPQTELTLTILVEPLATALDNCNAGVLKQLAHIVEDTMQKLVEGRLKGASASLDVSWQALLSRSTTGNALLHEPPTDEEDAILARCARELLDGCDRGAKADCVVALTGDLPAKRAGELANRDQSMVYKARRIAVNRRMAKDALAAAEAVSALLCFLVV